jgi:hypothetical protein
MAIALSRLRHPIEDVLRPTLNDAFLPSACGTVIEGDVMFTIGPVNPDIGNVVRWQCGWGCVCLSGDCSNISTACR